MRVRAEAVATPVPLTDCQCCGVEDKKNCDLMPSNGAALTVVANASKVVPWNSLHKNAKAYEVAASYRDTLGNSSAAAARRNPFSTACSIATFGSSSYATTRLFTTPPTNGDFARS